MAKRAALLLVPIFLSPLLVCVVAAIILTFAQ
jgi:hypothetical protein